MRQCLREWQRWPGQNSESSGDGEVVGSEASTDVEQVMDSKWLVQAVAKIQANLAELEAADFAI